MAAYTNTYPNAYPNTYAYTPTPVTPPVTPPVLPPTATESTQDLDFQDLQDLVGPKRVKTKEVEIEAQRPMDLQALQERRGRKAVTLGQFPRTMVKPKCSPSICRDDEGDCYR